MKENSKRPKVVMKAVFDGVSLDRDLMVSPHVVNFGKGVAAGKAVRVVLYVWNGILVGDGASV